MLTTVHSRWAVGRNRGDRLFFSLAGLWFVALTLLGFTSNVVTV
jgi:predicted small integral membrane protein